MAIKPKTLAKPAPAPLTKPAPGEPKPVKLVPKEALKRSKLTVLDIPLDMIVGHEHNPNEQDEATFDSLVQGMKEDGFDEPVHVVQIGTGKDAGKFKLTSGHHRVKAARVLGLDAAPAIIKEGWDDDKVDVELVKRNMLRGSLNPEKFTELYNRLIARGKDEALTKAQMGFTKEDAFKKVYQGIAKALPASQKKSLAKAKENIKSVDGLSSVLNKIFTEHGADLDFGFIVFNFGGKSHHFVEADNQLDKMMKKVEDECKERGITVPDLFRHLLANVDYSKVKKAEK